MPPTSILISKCTCRATPPPNAAHTTAAPAFEPLGAK